MSSYGNPCNDMEKYYTHIPQVYLEPPRGNLKLFELEELALKRLRLLKIIEKGTKSEFRKYSDEWKMSIVENIRVKYPDTFYNLIKMKGSSENSSREAVLGRQIDHISHFILRTTYGSDRDLQHWFIKQEADWLFLRFIQLTVEEQRSFLEVNHLIYSVASADEMINLGKNIGEYHYDEIFYKIPFREALKLIKKRKVNLYKGYAYVPSSLLVSCITYKFKKYLQNIFAHTKHNILLMSKRHVVLIEQLLKILNSDSDLVSDCDKTANKEERNITVKLSNLNKYAKRNFPLCMQHLYENLKGDHHLRYGARYQLGNFLKTIGLSLEESLQFWKSEFVQRITESAFDKNYSYFFKHMYGQVGSMREYRPQSCRSIICDDINIEEIHGCPFKMWDLVFLERKLRQRGISSAGIDAIEVEIRNERFEKACSKHFEAVHGTRDGEIYSPDEYFRDSFKCTRGNADEISSDEEDIFE